MNKPPKKSAVKRQPKKADGQLRPDPTFKEIIGQFAKQVGLKQINVEIPQLTSADLILRKEQNTNLADTMFFYFKEVTVIEFKSEKDTFTEHEFSDNIARCLLVHSKNREIKLRQILALYVSSEKPDAVLDYLQDEGITVTPEQDWLLRARYGNIDVAIVICRLLPLREEFYSLLMFAPASSNRWEEFVTMVIEQRNFELLKLLARLKPLELYSMIDYAKIDLEVPPEKAEAYYEALGKILLFFLDAGKNNPEIRKKAEEITLRLILAYKKPEEIIDELTPDQLEELIRLATERKNREKNKN
jgi:hypothetical protein